MNCWRNLWGYSISSFVTFSSVSELQSDSEAQSIKKTGGVWGWGGRKWIQVYKKKIKLVIQGYPVPVTIIVGE